MTTVLGPTPGPDTRQKRLLRPGASFGDRVFRRVTGLAGLIVLMITAGIGLFLFLKALPALRVAKFGFLTVQAWQPESHHFGIATILVGTILIALVGISVAIPLALGTALFISEIAPYRIKRLCVSLVDLMAAIPSVVFGIWGLKFLEGHFVGVARWISTWFGWIPIFHVSGADPTNPQATATVYTASTAIAGLVVGLMVTPIATSVMRETFSQAPVGEREGALALGATRWGMIRSVVLPYGRGGIIGGSMLGLGRAMGETIAVALIISPNLHRIDFQLLHSGAISVSSLVALEYSEYQSFGLSALFAAGLALFFLTMIINFSASAIVARSRSGAIGDA